MRRRRLSGGVVAGLAGAVLVGLIVTGPDGTRGLSSVVTGDGAAVSALHDRVAMVDGIRSYSSLSDLVASRQFVREGQAARPLTEAVVVGRVVEVRKGVGFLVEGADAQDGDRRLFDARDAVWRTVHLVVRPTTVVSGSVPAGDVTVGLAFGDEPSFDAIRDDVMSWGDSLFFLVRSPVFGYDPSVYGTVGDGELVGRVDDAGRITLPVLAGPDAATLLGTTRTVDDLVAAAREPVTTVTLDATGQVVG